MTLSCVLLAAWANPTYSRPAPPPIGMSGGWTTGLTHSVGAGSDRLLVFVTCAENSVDRDITGVTYGTRTMLMAIERLMDVGDGRTSRCEIYYLDEAGIQAASGNTFQVTYAGGNPSGSNHAAATFTGVNQAAPLLATASAGTLSGTTIATGPFNVAAGGMGVTGVIHGSSGSYNNGAWGAGWTEGTDQSPGGWTMGTASTTNPYGADGTDVATATHTLSTNRQVMVAISLAPLPIFGVDVSPAASSDTRLPTNGSNYTVDFTVSNLGNTTDSYDLLTSAAPGTAITVVSITGAGVSQGANPDSARLASLPVGDSAIVTVTYQVGVVPVGTIDTLGFLARSVASPAQSDDGQLVLTVIRPNITISKVVNPSGTQPPGTDLTYTATLTNAGTEEAVGVSSVSSIAPETEFKVGSVATSFPAGITVSVEYSDDAGSTWTYTPADQACGAPVGYDQCLTDIRWTLQNPLPSGAPDNAGTMEYVARIE